MGFYTPSQIVQDAQKHGIEVLDVDVNASSWDTVVEYLGRSPTIRLGMRIIAGLREDQARSVQDSIVQTGPAATLSELWARDTGATKATLQKLARADAFHSLGLGRHSAHWNIQALSPHPAPLDSLLTSRDSKQSPIREYDVQQNMFDDYSSKGLSLRAHPLQFARNALSSRGVVTAAALACSSTVPVRTHVKVAGLATIRQRPGTARGVVFITLEDETGTVNLIIRPSLFGQTSKIVMGSLALIASGLLERIGEVLYVDTREIESADPLLRADRRSGIPISTYSY